MGVGAAMVNADWITLASLWEAPTYSKLLLGSCHQLTIQIMDLLKLIQILKYFAFV
jgi:hypothetical protein